MKVDNAPMFNHGAGVTSDAAIGAYKEAAAKKHIRAGMDDMEVMRICDIDAAALGRYKREVRAEKK